MREYFDIELANLNNQLIGMGTLVESAIRNAVEIIANNSSELLDKAREQEELINTSERKIQNHCIRLLLHQAPVANDLREVSSALKMITDLERIGDQAIDIAEVSQYIKSRNNVINVTHIDEMATQASKMVTLAIDAFVKKDFELAKKVSKSDDVIDELFDKVKKETVEIIQRDKALGEEAIDLMMIAKYLERIGDHAEDIAEVAKYLNEDGSPAGSMNELREMSRAASAMVRNAVEAYATKDLDLANQVAASDDVVDSYFEKIKRDIATQISENVESAQHGLDSLMVAKYLERIGDHSVNLAEWVRFMITGNKY